MESCRPRKRPRSSLPAAKGLHFEVEQLHELNFSWTIVDGQLIVLLWVLKSSLAEALDGFLKAHPGGLLIRRAVGRDCSELFHAHHSSQRAEAVLAQYFVGYVGESQRQALRHELNKRMRHVSQQLPLAEAVALSMLGLFCIWSYYVYVQGSG